MSSNDQPHTAPKLSRSETIGRAFLIIAALIHEEIIPFDFTSSDFESLEAGLLIVWRHLHYFDQSDDSGNHAPSPLETLIPVPKGKSDPPIQR